MHFVLKVEKMGMGAVAVSLPFSCVLGLLSSMISSTMGKLVVLKKMRFESISTGKILHAEITCCELEYNNRWCNITTLIC